MRKEINSQHHVQFTLTLSVGLVASWSYLLEGASISCEAVSDWKIQITPKSDKCFLTTKQKIISPNFAPHSLA